MVAVERADWKGLNSAVYQSLPWVISEQSASQTLCALYPRKRTFVANYDSLNRIEVAKQARSIWLGAIAEPVRTVCLKGAAFQTPEQTPDGPLPAQVPLP